MSENKGETSETEILSYLAQSGFTKDEVENAMRSTGSRDIDSLVSFIINENQSKKSAGVKQVKSTSVQNNINDIAELTRKRREELEKEKLYKERLINQIRADMAEKLEKERIEDEQILSASAVEKTEDISDCKIKVWLGNGSSSVLGFLKNETVEDLFKRVEEKTGLTGFSLFRMNHTVPVERSSKKLSEMSELYPRGVLFVEE